MHHFLAVDIGAESGRLILGSLENEKLLLKEIHRFANGMLHIQGKYYWNIGQLYKEILNGFEICVQREKIQPESVGIDTWGVDYGLLAEDGTLLGLPFAYRDPRTENAIQEFTKIIPKEKIYKLTGNLFAPYNTLFQLFAAKKSHPKLVEAATDLLFMPDLLAYMLTGKKKTDFTFATTSQLYNPNTNKWEKELFDNLGISINLMQEIVEPGSITGYLNDTICKTTGMNKIPVIAVATHDTNSAIASIPAIGDNWAFISSGTWSLMGFESQTPIINDLAYRLNFSNEGGVSHTFNILKNHVGLWLLQQCRNVWKNKNYNYSALMQMAELAKPFKGYIDVDNMQFLNPSDMPIVINQYLNMSGQNSIDGHGQLIRVILESLALKFAETFHQITDLRGKQPEILFLSGGGVNNEVLCQFTADATDVPVKTGLAEGSSAGNVMVQALGFGYVKSLKDIRKIVANSFGSKTYYPKQTELWKEKALEFSSKIYQEQT
jgi:rhamnulokinase